LITTATAQAKDSRGEMSLFQQQEVYKGQILDCCRRTFTS